MEDLKIILLSEIIQSEKSTHCMDSIIQQSGKGKTVERVKRSVLARGLGKERQTGVTGDF